MAPRTFWKGYLKLSLVTCPVTMEPAHTAGETLRFHTVDRETGNRVESRDVDPGSGEILHISVDAVILDFGGVLWDMRWEVARDLSDAHGLPRSSVFETLYSTETWRHIERGRGDSRPGSTSAHAPRGARGRALPPLHAEWRRRPEPHQAGGRPGQGLRPATRSPCSAMPTALSGAVSRRRCASPICSTTSCARPRSAWPSRSGRVPPRGGAPGRAAGALRVRGRLGSERRGRPGSGHEGRLLPRRPRRRPARAARRAGVRPRA